MRWPYLMIFCSSTCWGWGETGHDTVARVAVRLLETKLKNSEFSRMSTPFVAKEHWLGHLSNVPDGVWRAGYQSNDVKSANTPTHYIQVETLIGHERKCQEIAQPITEIQKWVKSGNVSAEAGTLPWRVEEIYNALEQSIRAINADDIADKSKLRTKADAALTFAGLLAHFVADSAQPLHATENYDGYLTQQGGIHWFFEGTTVEAMDLGLIGRVYQFAKKNHPAKSLISSKSSALNLAVALACDSLQQSQKLLQLDKKRLVIKASPDDKSKPAERRPANEAIRVFEPMITARLALAADTLAELWIMAWRNAGAPDLSKYQNFDFPQAQPDFLKPSYIN